MNRTPYNDNNSQTPILNDEGRRAPYLTTRQVAKILGVAVRSVQSWVEQGKLEAWKTPGGHRRITRQSVESLQMERSLTRGRSKSAIVEIFVLSGDEKLLQRVEEDFAQWNNSTVHLTVTKSGIEGLLQMGRRWPDILVISANIPGVDAGLLLHAMRNHSRSRPISLVVLAANGGRSTGLPFLPNGVQVIPDDDMEPLKKLAMELSSQPDESQQGEVTPKTTATTTA